MSVWSGAASAPGAADQMLKLIALLDDPAALKAQLQELVDAGKKADASAEAASALVSKAAQDAAAVKTREDAVTAKEAAVKSREDAVTQSETDLAEAKAVHDSNVLA